MYDELCYDKNHNSDSYVICVNGRSIMTVAMLFLNSKLLNINYILIKNVNQYARDHGIFFYQKRKIIV